MNNPIYLVIFQTNQSCISTQLFVYSQLNVKTVLLPTIQFSISTEFSSIWPIDRTLAGVTTPDKSVLGSNGNEGVLQIPQNSCSTEVSPSVY